MDIKNVTVGQVITVGEWKSDTLKKGQMIAYASVFGNTDSYGDIVVKGAFANTLADWRKSGRVIPLLYGHNMSDPNMNIGAVLDAEEDDRGLKILAQFDDDDLAQKVYRLVKSGRLAELSFAFDTIKQAFLDDPERPGAYRELQEVKLYECSVVPIGANSETEVLAVKAAEVGLTAVAEAVKAGRTLSKANESAVRAALLGIQEAAKSLASVLPDDEPDDEPEDDPEEDTPEEDDDDTKSAAARVTSDPTQGVSAGNGPSLGESELKALADLISGAVVATMAETLGLIKAPPSVTGPSPSDPLVTEIQLLELGHPE